MSRNLLSGFEFIISLQGRDVTFERLPTSVTVKMAPSNYFRNFTGPEEMVIEGKEFVVSKRALDAQSFPTPRRGDVIYDPEIGDNTVSEVKELFILGKLAGYRLRTS